MMKRLLLLVLLAGVAHADDAEPWADGVSAAVQEQAQALFAEGNALFAQKAHAPALEKYKAAIALWDHPMIRFNMAVTLIRLDRVLEASDELARALRYGDKPFTPDLYQQARDYESLIQKQLGTISVNVDQPTHVVLDGKPWFDGPGSKSIRVTTGEHTIVGEQSGYLTASQTVVVAGGATVTPKIALVSLESAVKLHYRHPKWLPWTVAGGGAVIAVGGLAVSLWGRSQMDDFSRHFVAQCPGGCESNLSMHPELADERDSAELKGKIGVTMIVTGGIVAASGVVWAIVNRPIRSLPRIEATPTGATATMRWRF